ncbi:tryptophan synthase beta subunit-like PLP-dependent enzyme [Jimgerdemannia flammicorona]|uniref:Threonine dehydratase n=1 Tax=Jimgerdemannia flammicorona TaxID=994334 RepID=A0A433A2W1_9FUNG|nr:tryptophan synthase beta subunit-like PLP-dependent enzyme [Jimgerdemannia flammicorona]
MATAPVSAPVLPDFPTGKAILETSTSSPSRHLNGVKSVEVPDYLKLILSARVYEIMEKTPLQKALNLSTRLNTTILIKREDLTPVFSFKIRGAYNKLANLTKAEKEAGVIACSAGNHAQGVAMAAKHMNVKATIVMPLATPAIKWRNVRRLGAEVVLHGNDFEEAKIECARLTRLNGLTNIPPYDDPYVIAGQGTIGVEILQQWPLDEIRTIFACVGGGGLIAGIASYVKRICPQIKIVGVETVDADAMAKSLASGKREELKEVGLFADGAAVRLVGEEPFRIALELVDDMVLVTNDEICAAIKDIFEDTRSICEPAGALSVAGVRKYLELHPEECGKGAHVAILSGANMNFDRLRFVAERAELGEKTEAFCSVIIPERPGSFVKMISHIAPRAITEFSYRYSDPDRALIYTSFKVTDLRVDVPEIVANLAKDGMEARDISDNEVAKSHARYLVGGKSHVLNERLFRFEFPERPGALQRFLLGLQIHWNVSLFHYRNHGDDMGKVLVGIQVPPQDYKAFDAFLKQLEYRVVEETNNEVYQQFLR